MGRYQQPLKMLCLGGQDPQTQQEKKGTLEHFHFACAENQDPSFAELRDVVRTLCDDSVTARWSMEGLGFYFALNSSKAHEYPIKEMTQRPPGSQRRKMLLCRVATGREFRMKKNLDRGETVPPPGYDSVHGEGGTGSTLNWDELVVYSEEAVLPYAVVEYGFAKVARSDDV